VPLLTSISICLLVLEADSFSGLSLQSPRLAVESCELVAWPESMDYSVEKASKGIMSSFTSGQWTRHLAASPLEVGACQKPQLADYVPAAYWLSG
jgi:hypothetical protein